jgi:hypothetical protein
VTFDFKPANVLSELCVFILGFVALIYNETVESDVLKVHGFSGDHSITGDQDASLFPQDFHLVISVGLLFVVELNDGCALAPLGEFLLPVGLHGSWHNNEHFFNHFGIKETFEIGRDLNRFA